TKACLACRRMFNALLTICPTCGNGETTSADGPEWLLIVQAHVTTVQSNDRAVRFFREGRLDDAIAERLSGLEVNSQYATGHSNLGFLYLRKGQLDHAVECLLRALEVDPQHRDAPDHLIDVLHALINEVVQIGYRERFLSARPGGSFDEDNRHIRTREIGALIAKIGEKGVVRVDGRSLDSVQVVRVVVNEVQKRMGYHSKSTCLKFAREGMGGWYPSPASSTAASWFIANAPPSPALAGTEKSLIIWRLIQEEPDLVL
ncbi:MAG: tetratricopeptide repeat protein, partial [Candidatus Entotheonellia bacterium]